MKPVARAQAAGVFRRLQAEAVGQPPGVGQALQGGQEARDHGQDLLAEVDVLRRTLKRLPCCQTLSTPICPPIRPTSWLEMVSPRPVPPCVRVVEVSACSKA